MPCYFPTAKQCFSTFSLLSPTRPCISWDRVKRISPAFEYSDMFGGLCSSGNPNLTGKSSITTMILLVYKHGEIPLCFSKFLITGGQSHSPHRSARQHDGDGCRGLAGQVHWQEERYTWNAWFIGLVDWFKEILQVLDGADFPSTKWMMRVDGPTET